jgi:hypothetical protein
VIIAVQRIVDRFFIKRRSRCDPPTPCSLTSMDEPNQFQGKAADQLTEESVEQPDSASASAQTLIRRDFIFTSFLVNLTAIGVPEQ